MTPKQMADYLQITTDTVYRLIRSRQLVASRIGRADRVRQGDVESFLLAHSSRAEVRAVAFRRVLSIAERNSDVSSDDILEELEALDHEIKIARAGTPSAGIAPHREFGPPRVFGGIRGQIWIADDFDAPLPPEIQAYLSGEA